jgi:hypothetical protein
LLYLSVSGITQLPEVALLEVLAVVAQDDGGELAILCSAAMAT